MNDLIHDLESMNKGPVGPKVHLRIQQRTARKSITTIEGLVTNVELKKVLKAMKKRFSCNGAIIKSEEYGEIIKLSGDQRVTVRDFLCNVAQLVSKEDIVMHGF